MISERGRGHSHIFIGKEQNSFELRTWIVMIMCLSSMIIEITCGIIFGSLALVADGIHMGTHCIAFFLTAFAYSYSRIHQENPFFVFGTGKIAELASFTSGFILVIVACVIIYESITRFINPEKIIFLDALPVAFVGLTVNVASGVILMCKCSNRVNHGDNHGIEMSHDHGHSHGHATNQYEYEDLGDDENPITVDHHDHDHDHGHGHDHEEHEEHEEHEDHEHHEHEHDETFEILTSQGTLILSIYEEDVPPEFRISFSNWKESIPQNINVTTIRDDESTQVFEFSTLSGSDSSIVLHSTIDIPEPHQFKAKVSYTDSNGSNQLYSVDFIEHEHGHDHNHEHGNHHNQENQQNAKFHRDNNYRAAICHVVADAFVSILVIISLVIIGTTGKAQFLDPLVALIGAFVILSWSWTLIIDTSLNLLDTMPDKQLVNVLKKKIEMDGSIIDDLHVWRLGPGHLGAILSLRTNEFSRNKAYYLNKLKGFKSLSHITIEIEHEGNIV